MPKCLPTVPSGVWSPSVPEKSVIAKRSLIFPFLQALQVLKSLSYFPALLHRVQMHVSESHN